MREDAARVAVVVSIITYKFKKEAFVFGAPFVK
jgi:hypothetical protein